jgi:hypothetical protein
MAFVLQFLLCLYELQRLVINVYGHLFPQNVMFPLTTDLYNEIHFLVIGGVFPKSIRECLNKHRERNELINILNTINTKI